MRKLRSRKDQVDLPEATQLSIWTQDPMLPSRLPCSPPHLLRFLAQTQGLDVSCPHWPPSPFPKFFFFSSVQFSSVTQLCPTHCDPMNCSTPGLLVHHQLLEFTQTHVHRVCDAIQPPHPLSSPSPLVPNPSQHQDLFQWVNSSHEVAKVLEFQPQHQSF